VGCGGCRRRWKSFLNFKGGIYQTGKVAGALKRDSIKGQFNAGKMRSWNYQASLLGIRRPLVQRRGKGWLRVTGEGSFCLIMQWAKVIFLGGEAREVMGRVGGGGSTIDGLAPWGIVKCRKVAGEPRRLTP